MKRTKIVTKNSRVAKFFDRFSLPCADISSICTGARKSGYGTKTVGADFI